MAGAESGRLGTSPPFSIATPCFALPVHILHLTLPLSSWTGCTGAEGGVVRDHIPSIRNVKEQREHAKCSVMSS
jgi:hypothetical protein